MTWITRVFQAKTTAAASRQPTPSDAFANFAQWQQYRTDQAAEMLARHERGKSMQQWPSAHYPAHCVVCDATRALAVGWHGNGQPANLREGLACPDCRLNARQRAAFGLLRDRVGDDARVYATEQTTPAYAWIHRHYKHSRGSEYGVSAEKAARLKPWMHSLGVDEPIVNEDVTALSFADASQDAIVSFDELEHVPDYEKALHEFARVLAPGGLLVLTAPFMETTEKTSTRARIGADGNVEHLLPPEIHGDPVSGGVLCFYHFGWDVLDVARAAGFTTAEWHRTWSPDQGAFGLWTMLATR